VFLLLEPLHRVASNFETTDFRLFRLNCLVNSASSFRLAVNSAKLKCRLVFINTQLCHSCRCRPFCCFWSRDSNFSGSLTCRGKLRKSIRQLNDRDLLCGQVQFVLWLGNFHIKTRRWNSARRVLSLSWCQNMFSRARTHYLRREQILRRKPGFGIGSIFLACGSLAAAHRNS
jgi:hypothetical protein